MEPNAPLPAGDRAVKARNPRAAKVTLGVLAALATGLFLWVVLPFWSPLLLAAVLAAVFQWPLDRLTGVMKGRRRSAGIPSGSAIPPAITPLATRLKAKDVPKCSDSSADT